MLPKSVRLEEILILILIGIRWQDPLLLSSTELGRAPKKKVENVLLFLPFLLLSSLKHRFLISCGVFVRKPDNFCSFCHDFFVLVFASLLKCSLPWKLPGSLRNASLAHVVVVPTLNQHIATSVESKITQHQQIYIMPPFAPLLMLTTRQQGILCFGERPSHCDVCC